MDFVRLAEFPADSDLRPISELLNGQGITHRLVIEGETAVLYVPADTPLESVAEILQSALLNGTGRAETPVSTRPGFVRLFRRTPALFACLVLSVLGAAVPEWMFPLLHWLTFQNFTLISPTEIEFATLQDTLDSRQYWRLITPAFIHFGIFHIAFNGLWLWEFGRRIEVLNGSFHFVMLVLVSAIASNFSQYFWGGPSLFGGMSGVLYALLGYLWIRNRVAPNPVLRLPPGIIGFMLAWLVICMTGVVDLFFRGSVANAAHASGLLVGMFLGGVFGLLEKSR